MKGADPHIRDYNQTNIYHVTCYLARVECISLVNNYERHIFRVETKKKIKNLMTEFNFKKSDIHKGVLISSDKHIEEVQKRFDEFKYNICKLYEDYINILIEKFKLDLMVIDAKNRNPIHYAAFSKHTKLLKIFYFLIFDWNRCSMTAMYLLNFGLNSENYEDFLKMYEELQNLEANREKKVDPRQFANILSSKRLFS